MFWLLQAVACCCDSIRPVLDAQATVTLFLAYTSRTGPWLCPVPASNASNTRPLISPGSNWQVTHHLCLTMAKFFFSLNFRRRRKFCKNFARSDQKNYVKSSIYTSKVQIASVQKWIFRPFLDKNFQNFFENLRHDRAEPGIQKSEWSVHFWPSYGRKRGQKVPKNNFISKSLRISLFPKSKLGGLTGLIAFLFCKINPWGLFCRVRLHQGYPFFLKKSTHPPSFPPWGGF